MVWYEIVVTLLGAFGGLAGVAAFIKSFWMLKPEKNSKEISNEHAEIANLREFIAIANENYDRLKTEFKEYKDEVDGRIAFFKQKFDKMEQEKELMEAANMQANRCPFPPTLDDCPVIKYLKSSPCEGCKHAD
jgi:predicted  nucleic acid-binding Zn-ribbon protein